MRFLTDHQYRHYPQVVVSVFAIILFLINFLQYLYQHFVLFQLLYLITLPTAGVLLTIAYPGILLATSISPLATLPITLQGTRPCSATATTLSPSQCEFIKCAGLVDTTPATRCVPCVVLCVTSCCSA